MSELIIPNSALIVIDVQVGIDQADHWGGNRNNPGAEENIEKLVKAWTNANYPIVIVQHDSAESTSPLRRGHSGNLLKEFVPAKGVKLIRKSTTSAFIRTELEDYLDERMITAVVVTGFVTNNSVESTVRMAGDLGFRTIVVSDATACFGKKGLDGTNYDSDLIHQISLANLSGEFATILTTNQILRSLKP